MTRLNSSLAVCSFMILIAYSGGAGAQEAPSSGGNTGSSNVPSKTDMKPNLSSSTPEAGGFSSPLDVESMEDMIKNPTDKGERRFSIAIKAGLISNRVKQLEDTATQIAKAISTDTFKILNPGLPMPTTYLFGESLGLEPGKRIMITYDGGFGTELDLRYKITKSLSVGLRIGYQRVSEPFILEARETAYFSPAGANWTTIYRETVNYLSLIPVGIQAHYVAKVAAFDIYGGLGLGLYRADLGWSAVYKYLESGSFEIIMWDGSVSGIGIGIMLQAGIQMKLFKKTGFFLEGTFESATIKSLIGTWTRSERSTRLSPTGYPTSGDAVWAQDTRDNGQVYHGIYDSDQVDDALLNVESAGLTIGGIRANAGIRIGF